MRHLQKAARSSTQSNLWARGTPKVSDADTVRHPSSSLTELGAADVVHAPAQDSVCRMRVIRSNYYRGRHGIVRLVETGRRR
jgi:hypothetical protein